MTSEKQIKMAGDINQNTILQSMIIFIKKE